MKGPYNLNEAARFMGVTFQAVQQRFAKPVGRYIERDGWRIPHAELVKWQKERIANAKAKLAAVSPAERDQ